MSDSHHKPREISKGFLGLMVLCALALGAVLLLSACDRESSSTSRADVGVPSRPEGNFHRVAEKQRPGDNQGQRDAALQTFDRSTLIKRWQQIDDPLQDGWDTEAFSAAATSQLKQIGKLLQKPKDLATAQFDNIAANDFRCEPLQPDPLETIFSDAIFQVQRMRRDEDVQKSHLTLNDPEGLKGPEGLKQALEQLAKPFAQAKNIRTKFKIFRVHMDDDTKTTRQYVAVTGTIDDGAIEQHATWDAHWQNRPDAAPLLASLDVIDFEQIHAHVPTDTLFSDCTKSVLENNSCYTEQFQRGYSYWMFGVPYTRYQITEMMGHPGLAIADVNGDGLDDLYVCQEQGLPNRLFLQQNDGTALESSAAWGVDWIQACRSALFVDLDNDGDQDLVVSFLGGVLVASNEAETGFRVRTVIPTGDDMLALAAADVENDGDLDLYATAYYSNKDLSEQQTAGLPASDDAFVYHDANAGGKNTLLRNDVKTDDWSFVDITKPSGLATNNTRYSFAASWEDYDNDGDQDLYVANDYGRDNLYRNDAGHFVDVAAEAGAEDAASGMSISWSDFNRDGWMDAYISNMWSSAGNRIAFQPHFKQHAPAEVKKRLQRFARGNTLLRNTSKARFEDVSRKAGVEMGRWAWGSLFADVNNDGWDDILIANGFITKDDDGGDL
ncbi:MAG: VCBS repeat-containing protein [Pirellulales bacterium]|nr:VCBS repeat-containing protein [Pirellulales bacterium]